MSIKNLFRKRKQMPLETAKLEACGEKLVGICRQLLIHQSPLYRSHLHNLENTSDMAINKMVFGYALERAARKLDPKIIGNDFSKPTLCMVCIGEEYAKIVEVGTQTKFDYCKKHGYNLVILDLLPYRYGRHPAWLRIPLMFRLMQMGHEHLFYLDADSLITNPGILLEGFFDRLEKSDRHLMIAEDVFSLNTGSFFMRKTWQSLTLLDLIYESDAELKKNSWEQQALTDLVEKNPAVKSLLYLELNARLFNSMPFDPPLSPGLPSDCSAYAWQPGDFICHFAGTRGHAELSLKLQKFHKMIPVI